jgi:site-specific DNA-methyltransferase (cytosine-N4-specific)
MVQPTPPTKASLKNGRLKDTAPNRALSPKTTPQALFTSEALTENAFFANESTLIFHGQVKDKLRLLIESGIKVDCIVTSPPYYGQRDYGVFGQLGHEKHPSEYLRELVEIFTLCGELLKDTGSLWVNIGDTYWSGKGAHKSSESKQEARRFGLRPQDRPGDGKWARPKQLLLLPHRMAVAMQDAGWIVRNDNVWVKPNPVPDQVRDRCSTSHEYVFHFTKNRWYYFNRQAVGRKMDSGTLLPPLDTWEVAVSAGNGTHKAAFSPDLVRIPILATTPPKGVVLDPFCGSGTSLAFARANGFRSIGIDLKKQYCEESQELVTTLLP